MIRIACAAKNCQTHTAGRELFQMTSPKGVVRIMCAEHAAPLEAKGWAFELLRADEDMINEVLDSQEWAGIGRN